MQIQRNLFERMVTLFANNALLLDHAAGTAIKVQFVNIAFTPSLDRVLAEVPAQTSGLGATEISVADAAPAEYTDVINGERVVEFAPDGVPLVVEGSGGGYAGSLFGTRLVNSTAATLLAMENFAAPLPMAADAQSGGEIPRIRFRFPPSMVR